MVNDVLVSRARLGERIQVVHVEHVAPQTGQVTRNVKVHEVLACIGNNQQFTSALIRLRPIKVAVGGGRWQVYKV